MWTQMYTIPTSVGMFANRAQSVLGRVSCVLDNAYVCDEDNQTVEYKRLKDKCESCLIRLLYEAALDKLKTEWELADLEGKRALEAEAMADAKDTVSSPLVNQ